MDSIKSFEMQLIKVHPLAYFNMKHGLIYR